MAKTMSLASNALGPELPASTTSALAEAPEKVMSAKHLAHHGSQKFTPDVFSC
jgi:hypothetical protein